MKILGVYDSAGKAAAAARATGLHPPMSGHRRPLCRYAGWNFDRGTIGRLSAAPR